MQAAIQERFLSGEYSSIYWDNIVLEQLPNLNIKRQPISQNDIYELDSLEDLQNLYKELDIN